MRGESQGRGRFYQRLGKSQTVIPDEMDEPHQRPEAGWLLHPLLVDQATNAKQHINPDLYAQLFYVQLLVISYNL